ncbi:hypothetical protein OHA25_61115 (plasmid) [Nonomuraea sp. NBC_00507]|uniref:hypothetical protein n=1 Tax=Nonomuraea sp. NBC_00507 TaxID=2976002 RepID=UPI002E19CA07
MIRRFWRWLFEPVTRPFAPGFVAFLAALSLTTFSVSLWFVWYALETGNGHVLLIVAVFAVLGLADLVRRLMRSSR